MSVCCDTDHECEEAARLALVVRRKHREGTRDREVLVAGFLLNVILMRLTPDQLVRANAIYSRMTRESQS